MNECPIMVRRLAKALHTAYQSHHQPHEHPLGIEPIENWLLRTLADPDEALLRQIMPDLLVRFEQQLAQPKEWSQ